MMGRSACLVLFAWCLPFPLAAQVWTQLPGADPTLARYHHAGAYDLIHDRLVVFGGRRDPNAVTLGDTLLYDGTSWTIVATAVSPSPRSGHGMAFDLVRARVVLFGGQGTAGAALNDTWEWDGNTWQLMPTTTALTPRMHIAMTADLLRGAVLMHGGYDGRFTFGDLWRWTGSQWLLLDNTGPELWAHAMAINPRNGELVLFGGWNQGVFGDTWIWNGSWRQASVAGPRPRMGHSMTSDFQRSRVVLTGGLRDDDGTASGETWVFDGQSWFRLGDGPRRYCHVLEHDLSRGRSLETGGVQSPALDVWSFGGAAPGVIQPFGHGCGSGGAPTLAATTAPRLGALLQLNTSSSVGTTVYLLGFSATTWSALSLPLDLAPLGAAGCVLYVEPAMMDVAVPVAGATTHSYLVPNNAALVGVEFFAQVMAADPAANFAGIAASNALAGTFGP
jgi:hypothetical protein